MSELTAGADVTPDFRVVAGPFYTDAQLSLARRYTTIEDAVAAMGEGMVLSDPRGEGRLAAFHEKHLTVLERRAASVS